MPPSNRVRTVAYLANLYPVAVEPYVHEEILELESRGVTVIPGSARRPRRESKNSQSQPAENEEILYLRPVRAITLLRAIAFAVGNWRRISGLLRRVLLEGKESPARRLKALLHTGLGACYAASLRNRGVDHIHVHHGYFGAWVAMVAARLLGISYSMTLHGSDILLHGVYLDTKLGNCQWSATVSEYNRRYLLERFPETPAKKLIVSRLGVDTAAARPPSRLQSDSGAPRTFKILAVGRLHAVKNHAFLIRSCARLCERIREFECAIAGEGPERQRLESLIHQQKSNRVTLLGHVTQRQLDRLYRDADLVVLTSVSEGIPLVLMEAMVRGAIVLAPRITGIPELVIPGKTGFLYESGDSEDFLERLCFLQRMMCREGRAPADRLNWIRHAARVHVLHNFNRRHNLTCFGDVFLQSFEPNDRSLGNENPVLQQV